MEKKRQKTELYAQEAQCNRDGCTRTSYYELDGKPWCGRCSSKKRQERRKLKTNPQRFVEEAQRLKDHDASVERAREENAKEGKRGQVICTKIRGVFGSVQHVEGFLTVPPNNRHRNLKGCLSGCDALSPKKLGPVKVDGLPVAHTIEAFHQGRKCWTCELDPTTGLPGPQFYRRMEELFALTHNPPRHKYGHTKDEHLKALRALGEDIPKGSNVNVPLYSVLPMTTADGKRVEVSMSYVDSREDYCVACEKLMSQTSIFKTLKEKLESGTNLNIAGYDGSPFASKEDLFSLYVDERQPFGHELVLCCLLLDVYPWREYKRSFTILRALE